MRGWQLPVSMPQATLGSGKNVTDAPRERAVILPSTPRQINLFSCCFLKIFHRPVETNCGNLESVATSALATLWSGNSPAIAKQHGSDVTDGDCVQACEMTASRTVQAWLWPTPGSPRRGDGRRGHRPVVYLTYAELARRAQAIPSDIASILTRIPVFATCAEYGRTLTCLCPPDVHVNRAVCHPPSSVAARRHSPGATSDAVIDHTSRQQTEGHGPDG